MAELCRRVDRVHAASYLETDKWQNVAFYKRFGFEEISRDQVLGAPTWYMGRLAP